MLNRHRASRSSDFKITRVITAPLGSVNKICIVSLQLSEFYTLNIRLIYVSLKIRVIHVLIRTQSAFVCANQRSSEVWRILIECLRTSCYKLVAHVMMFERRELRTSSCYHYWYLNFSIQKRSRPRKKQMVIFKKITTFLNLFMWHVSMLRTSSSVTEYLKSR